jgi:AcrR family transcriptional regulator
VAGNGRKNADGVLVAALAGGMTVAESARQAGIGERTVYRRLEDPAFRWTVADARGRLLEHAVGQLAEASTAAAATLRALLDAEADTVRLGAARSILELGGRLREWVELEARIAALEARGST